MPPKNIESSSSKPMTGSPGPAEPELGGDPSLVDVIGLNFYPHNQWYYDGPTIPMGHHEYRPLADMLVEVAERYGKPIFLSETGAEGHGQAVLASLCLQRGARWRRVAARRSRASAGIRSRPIPAGTIHGMPKPGCCRQSRRTAAATSISRLLKKNFEAQRALFGCSPEEWRTVAGGGRY